MKHFNTLYTNGCSLTKFEPIPLDQQWSHLVGKKLNIPKVINDAVGCGSNPRILRTTFNYIQKRKDDPSLYDTLFLIQFSWPFRFEFKEFSGKWARCNESSAVCKDQSYAKVLTQLKLKYNCPEENRYNFLGQALAIENLFKSYNIENYFFLSFYSESFPDDYKDFINNNINWLFDDIFKSQITTWGWDTFSNEDHHPSVKGNQQIADKIYNQLLKKINN